MRRGPRPVTMALVKTNANRRTAAIVGAGVVTLVALFALLHSSTRYRENWHNDQWGRVALVAHFVSVVAAVTGGAFLVSRRPRNRCGYVGIAIGLVLGAWFVAVFRIDKGSGWWLLVGPTLVWSLRPLLFWLVLAFPIGRLDRTSRRLWWLFVVGNAVAYAVTALIGGDDPSYPFDVFHESAWTLLSFSVWWDFGALVWLSAILVVVQRRRLRFRGSTARPMLNAAWYAALAATGADFVLVMHGPLRDLDAHGLGLTPFGTVVVFLDYARWGLVVAILAVAARRSWPRESKHEDAVEIEESALDATIARHPRRRAGRSARRHRTGPHPWLGRHDGRAAPRTGRRPGDDRRPARRQARRRARVRRRDHRASNAARRGGDRDRATARGRAGRRSLPRNENISSVVSRDVLDAEDHARHRLERDLHDGAQQALVGLSLQAALAARGNGHSSADGTAAASELAAAIDGARTELIGIASGRPPALLAERGLDGALGALVLTAGLPVRVVADPCADLTAALQRALWFVAAEAVTNALKHAQASSLELTLVRTDHTVILTVSDDGCGGVHVAPGALAARVNEAGGHLDVQSNDNGTTVCARFAEATA